MPTYLRWTVSITSGITVFFAYSMLTLGILRASGQTQVVGAANGLLGLGAYLVTMITALAVNDWLARRYPRQPADSVTE